MIHLFTFLCRTMAAIESVDPTYSFEEIRERRRNRSSFNFYAGVRKKLVFYQKVFFISPTQLRLTRSTREKLFVHFLQCSPSSRVSSTFPSCYSKHVALLRIYHTRFSKVRLRLNNIVTIYFAVLCKSHQVADLGWVNFHLGSSAVCPILLRQILFWQNRMSNLARW